MNNCTQKHCMLYRITQFLTKPLPNHSFSISAGNNIQLAGDVSAVTTLATRAVYIKAAFFINSTTQL